MRRKLLALLLAFCMVLTACGGKGNDAKKDQPKDQKQTESKDDSKETQKEGVKEKVVETSADGYGGPINVKTSFDKDGKITKVEIGDNKETKDIGGKVIEQFPEKIVEGNSIAIDALSGATITSKAVLSAVEKAITEAGFDVNNYKKEAESGEKAELKFKAGTYEGKAIGYGGDVKVKVDVDEKSIKSVKVEEHTETDMISDMAINELPKKIVESQSTGIDTVSGCTFSSLAVIGATNEALKQSGVDMDALQKKVEAKEVAKTDEEMEAEVIIIGAGGAGLSAGVAAFENGAKKVIILEKMPFAGGNTLRAGGAMNAVDPEKQAKSNIEDSIEKHFTQTYEGGHKVADKELVKILTDNAPKAVKWLEEQGVEFKPEIGSVVGSMWPRSHQTEKTLGTGYIDALVKKFEEKGGQILYNTKAEELVQEGKKVIGVKATSPEKNLTLKGSKGIIIASGGYAFDPELAKEKLNDKGVYNKDNLPEKLESTNHPGATGDGIVMAEKVGAKAIDMEHIQLLPMPGHRFGPSINVEDSFFINKEGKRYVKEDGGRDELCLAAFEQTDGQYYMITDSQIVGKDRKTLSGENLDTLIKKEYVVEKETLKELADAIGVPADALEKTTEEFNKAVDAKKDEFGRKVWGKKIEKGPFYATLRYPALHHTMGGLKINTETQVLDENDKPIEGLYAAGEVTGGIHGANRLGGNAIADIIVFGRIAGEKIMK